MNDSVFDKSVRSLGISERAARRLDDAEVATVRDLCNLHRRDILKIRHAGQTVLRDIENALSEHGLSLGMKVEKTESAGTRRERIATTLLSEMVRSKLSGSADDMATFAVQAADTLIARLDATEVKP